MTRLGQAPKLGAGNPDGYKVIIADPPWRERGGGRIKRGADRHYPLMSTPEIRALGPKVDGVAAPDALLFLWTTANHLPDALEVMDDWGFKYVTNMVWVKPRIGLGQYTRMAHEHVLIGRRRETHPSYGDPERHRYPSVIHAPRGRHSEKPQEMFDIAESFQGPYLEIFSRNRRPGWDAWGNEVGVWL